MPREGLAAIRSGMHDPSRCPQCGERVSPFAAGCAICGADLDPTRWQAPPSWRSRLAMRLPGRLASRTRAKARTRR